MSNNYEPIQKPLPSDYGLPENPIDYFIEEQNKYLEGYYKFSRIWKIVVLLIFVVGFQYLEGFRLTGDCIFMFLFSSVFALVFAFAPDIYYKPKKEKEFEATEEYKRYRDYQNAVEKYKNQRSRN